MSIKKLIVGLRQLEGDGTKHDWLPITKDILLKLLTRLDTTKELQAIVHAAYCLAFAGFLRIGEFTYSTADLQNPTCGSWCMTRGSINLQDDKLLLSLPASKTN